MTLEYDYLNTKTQTCLRVTYDKTVDPVDMTVLKSI